MDYAQLLKNDTPTIVKTIIAGAIGFALVTLWNTTITQIIHIVYPPDTDDKNTYKHITARIVYALVATLLAIAVIKILI